MEDTQSNWIGRQGAIKGVFTLVETETTHRPQLLPPPARHLVNHYLISEQSCILSVRSPHLCLYRSLWVWTHPNGEAGMLIRGDSGSTHKPVSMQARVIYYRPQTKFGARLYFYTCLSFCSGGVCLSACWDNTTPPPRDQAQPLDQAHTTPGTMPLPPQPCTHPRTMHPPGTEHAGRYGQSAGGTHPTRMQSCSDVSLHFLE